MNSTRRVLEVFRPDSGRIGAVVALLIAGIAANLLKPWPLAIIVDSILGDAAAPEWLGSSDNAAMLVALGGLIFVIHIGHGALSALQNYLSIKVGLSGLRRVRKQVFDRLQQLSMRFHLSSRSGDLIYRAAWDTFAFQKLFQQGAMIFVTSLLSLSMMAVVMFQLSPRLTFVALALAPMILVTIKLFGKRMRDRGIAAEQADSRVTSAVEQNITAMPLIRSYTMEDAQSRSFNGAANDARSSRLSQHAWELVYWLALAVVFGAGMAGTVWLGSHQVIAGELTVGELLIFVVYLGQLYEPLNQLSHVGATVASAGAGAERVFELLDSAEEITDMPDAKSLDAKTAAGGLELKNVSFGYSANKSVLRDVSLRLEPGQSAALIGPSGAGKTTLLNLIPRFFDPDSGAVELGGINLRELKLDDLRHNVSLVLQEPLLMPASLAENIAYGKPSATQKEIEAAAAAANAHEFISSLPQGYDTVVGDGAVRLSTGEKQRINLARAFLKDAPVLLLDEPTSALDADGETAILESLARLTKDRTCLIVAHRLQTVESVDKIIVLDKGQIVEQGAPSELAESGGYYSRALGGQTSFLSRPKSEK